MVLDPIPQSLPVHFFGSRPQPPTSRENKTHKHLASKIHRHLERATYKDSTGARQIEKTEKERENKIIEQERKNKIQEKVERARYTDNMGARNCARKRGRHKKRTREKRETPVPTG